MKLKWNSIFFRISCNFMQYIRLHPFFKYLIWTLDVSRRSPMKSLSSICLPLSAFRSVCLSVTKFSQDWILSFFLTLYTMIAEHDEARFLKKIWRPQFGSSELKLGLKLGFLSFSQVWFISFPLIYIKW